MYSRIVILQVVSTLNGRRGQNAAPHVVQDSRADTGNHKPCFSIQVRSDSTKKAKGTRSKISQITDIYCSTKKLISNPHLNLIETTRALRIKVDG